MPATLTRMSKRSPWLANSSAMACTRRLESVTSNAYASADPPASVMEVTVASAPATSMSAATAWTPAAARALHVARPRPLAPPVTKATRPSSAGTHPPHVELCPVPRTEAPPYRVLGRGRPRGTLCSAQGLRGPPDGTAHVRILLWNVHGGYSDSPTSGGPPDPYPPP